jgi:hypothetical protein
VPNTNNYSKASDNYFNSVVKNYCLDGKKMLKIREEYSKSFENEVKRESIHSNIINSNNKNSDIIKIESDLISNFIKIENPVERKESDNCRAESNSVKNINEPAKDYFNNNSNFNHNSDKTTNNLNSLIISKKTNRTDSANDMSSSLYDTNKKMKIEKEIKQYMLPIEQAEKQIKESKNIIGIKLICEKDPAFNLFSNMVINN